MSNLNNYQATYKEFKYIISPLKNDNYLVVITPPPPVDVSSALPVERFNSIEECNQAIYQHIDYFIAGSVSLAIDKSEKLK